MRIIHVFSLMLAVPVALGSMSFPLAQAVQLSDGSTHFVQPPRLISATTTFNIANVWNSTYFFTLNLPENAGEPLQRVTISLREGGDFPRFFLDDSRAFSGTSENRDRTLSLGEVTQDRDSQTLTVNFDPPVPPGQTVTIRLHPVRNPRYSGVYLFGVTAFPPGENPRGQFLGYGRLHFYEARDFSWY